VSRKVFIVGVGMTKFEKPFSRGWDYPDMVKESGSKAFADAGSAEDIEQVAAGYCYGTRPRPAGLLRAGDDRGPGLQRQQQLRDRLDCDFMIKQFIEGGIIDACWRWASRRWRRGRSG
jgi:sterol carrier protein 2